MNNSVWHLLKELETKKGISEVIINNIDSVFVEKSGQLIQLNVQLTHEDIDEFIQDVAQLNHKECDSDHPILDGNLEDGSRINVIIPPFVSKSPSITIRKYLRFISNFQANPRCFGLNPAWIEFLQGLIQAKMNIIVSGGTGAGKTTFLNLLLNEVDPKERIITIEDTLELSFAHKNTVRLEARQASLSSNVTLTTKDLVKNTLRMRPDRIIIGEVRGGELFDLFQAMNTGHEGSMTSIHANSTVECLDRMEGLFLMSGFDLPYGVVRKHIASAVDFIIQISRDREGNRVVSDITEVTGMEGDQILTNSIAQEQDGELRYTGFPPSRTQLLAQKSDLTESFFADSGIKIIKR